MRRNPNHLKNRWRAPKQKMPPYIEEMRRKAKAGDINAKLRFLELLGAGPLLGRFRKKASLKEFHSSMRRLEEYLEKPPLKKSYFVKMGSSFKRERIKPEEVLADLAEVKQAFKLLSKKGSTENKAGLFDSVERMRIAFGSDYKVVVGGDRSGASLLIGSLMANMREASMHLLVNDPGYKEFAERVNARVDKHLENLKVTRGERKSIGRQLEEAHFKSNEMSGGAKIEIKKGKPRVVLAFLNPEQAYWDNPVLIKPLMEHEADFYFHSHPAPSGFSGGGRSGRWNLDWGTAKALGLPFVLFAGGKMEILHKGKIKYL